mmetsp:Transcript_11483/g.40879  ORF Transcript_11483/g.40879 Transcript_11483/m.40879 type:complete len:345 (+) Transcript_11483:2852-3886(+)
MRLLRCAEADGVVMHLRPCTRIQRLHAQVVALEALPVRIVRPELAGQPGQALRHVGAPRERERVLQLRARPPVSVLLSLRVAGVLQEPLGARVPAGGDLCRPSNAHRDQGGEVIRSCRVIGKVLPEPIHNCPHRGKPRGLPGGSCERLLKLLHQSGMNAGAHHHLDRGTRRCALQRVVPQFVQVLGQIAEGYPCLSQKVVRIQMVFVVDLELQLVAGAQAGAEGQLPHRISIIAHRDGAPFIRRGLLFPRRAKHANSTLHIGVGLARQRAIRISQPARREHQDARGLNRVGQHLELASSSHARPAPHLRNSSPGAPHTLLVRAHLGARLRIALWGGWARELQGA